MFRFSQEPVQFYPPALCVQQRPHRARVQLSTRYALTRIRRRTFFFVFCLFPRFELIRFFFNKKHKPDIAVPYAGRRTAARLSFMFASNTLNLVIV